VHVNLGDVRRLMITIGVLGLGTLGWLLFLGLVDNGKIDSNLGTTALENLAIARWLWFGNVAFVITLGFIIYLLYLVKAAPSHFARGIARQVQCQDCKAVFMIHDTGHRPVTHVCPNCQALGVYDGKAPPVGLPPRPETPRRIIDLGLACQTCNHAFNVTDTGARPLQVKCPSCKSHGVIR
jgi:Zn finger protein HypA/HybF involved in hydrogenase expression